MSLRHLCLAALIACCAGQSAFALTVRSSSSGVVTVSDCCENPLGFPFAGRNIVGQPYTLTLTSDIDAMPPGANTIYGFANASAFSLTVGGQTFNYSDQRTTAILTLRNDEPLDGVARDTFWHDAYFYWPGGPTLIGGYTLFIRHSTTGNADLMNDADASKPRTLALNNPIHGSAAIDLIVFTDEASPHPYSFLGRPSSVSLTVLSAVPEPAQALMLVAGLTGMAIVHRGRRRRAAPRWWNGRAWAH